MTTFKEAAEIFLSNEKFAVVGVSRTGTQTANGIYRKMRQAGYQVFPVNPNVDTVEGDPCYPDVTSIPARLDGAVIVTSPAAAYEVVKQCAEAGIPRVWMHENGLMGAKLSSVSPDAVNYCHENGIEVIAGGCPMMFLEFGHKCMRWVMGAMGRLPAM